MSKRRRRKRGFVQAARELVTGAQARKVRAVFLGDGPETCPSCQGSGFTVPSHEATKDKAEAGWMCKLCHGRGVIAVAVCRGCGKPAPWHRCGVFYCGGKRCRKLLMGKVVLADVKPSGPVIILGARGPCDHKCGKAWNAKSGWSCLTCKAKLPDEPEFPITKGYTDDDGEEMAELYKKFGHGCNNGALGHC